MKTVRTESGRSILLLEAWERQPKPTGPDRRQAGETVAQFNARAGREYPSIVLRRRGEFWYQIHPKTDSALPRDPKTGDKLQRGSSKAQRELDSRRTEGKTTGKGAVTARAKRKRASVTASTTYNLSGGGTTQIPLNKAKGRRA